MPRKAKAAESPAEKPASTLETILKDMEAVKSAEKKPRKVKSAPEAAPEAAPVVADAAPVSGGAKEPKERKNNGWLGHVKEYRAANPAVSYKDSLKLAKETYSKK